MLRTVLIPATAALAVVTGCVIVTGSTDGYDLADAGAAQTSADAAAGALDLQCLSTSSCAGDGAVGALCCVTITGTSSARSACQPGPCGGTLPVQLCASDAECTGTTCVTQTCSLAGASVTVRACGALPTCTR